MSTSSTVVRRGARRTTGWSFVLPFVVLLVVFGLAPIAYAIYSSFIVTPVIGSSYFSFTQNFTDVFADNRLATATVNVALYLLVWLPLLLVVVFVAALVMDAKRTRFASIARFISYVPGAVTGSAAALLWLFMFSPLLSPVGFLLTPFAGKNGLIVSDSTLPVILAVMGIAAGAGGWIVLLFGALTAIPSDIIESARIDGANVWDQMWHIKLPMLRTYIGFILIVSLANGFQVFVEPQVLRSGAQGQVSQSWSINQIVFNYAAGESNYGRASALSILLLIVTVTAAIIVITRTRFYSAEGR